MARQTARRPAGRKATTKAKAQPKAKAAAKPKAKAQPKAHAKPRAKAKAEPAPKPRAKTKAGGRPTAREELKRKTAAGASNQRKGRAPAKRTAPRRVPPTRKLYPTPVLEPEPVEDEPILEPEGEPETFTTPIVGATVGSAVIVTVVAILNTGLGRDLEKHLDAPARTLVAAPVIALAVVVVVACLVALVPAYRRDSLRVAEIAGWLIPSWLVMIGMGIAAVAWAIDHG